VTFKVVNDPYIIQQPVNQTLPRHNGHLHCRRYGHRLSVEKNGVNITGATSATLVLNLVAPTDVASYTCVVTGANGSVTSSRRLSLWLVGGQSHSDADRRRRCCHVDRFLHSALVQQRQRSVSAGGGRSSPYTNSAPQGTDSFGRDNDGTTSCQVISFGSAKVAKRFPNRHLPHPARVHCFAGSHDFNSPSLRAAIYHRTDPRGQPFSRLTKAPTQPKRIQPGIRLSL